MSANDSVRDAIEEISKRAKTCGPTYPNLNAAICAIADLADEALTQLDALERDREAMEGLREVGGILRKFRDSPVWYYYPDSGRLAHPGTIDPADAILGKQGEGRPEPDSDFCSKCREHTGFEWDEEAEEWLSVCCGYPPVDLGGG